MLIFFGGQSSVGDEFGVVLEIGKCRQNTLAIPRLAFAHRPLPHIGLNGIRFTSRTRFVIVVVNVRC